ncbi:hypothetical protein [Micromonospora coxensis]|uniref:Uncharacterized protein n=1 Tax=Micromonospora coxensis TaxID=356852 RepID=A0A1C5H143_9ACTN|nr:hypothetical protein [Micromonospora coxensis]SCG39131.1 hypothetical protein GA0070614_0600 [Micromonospora coxensis]
MARTLAQHVGIVQPDYRMFEIRDREWDPTIDIPEAIVQSHRQVAGSSGRVIVVTTADWLAPCHLTIDVHDEQPPPPGEGWHGRVVLPLHTQEGVVSVNQGTLGDATGLEEISLGAGPGEYGFAVHHRGREEARRRADAIREAAEDTDDEEDTIAAVKALAGIERYLIQVWPVRHA